MLLSSKVGMRSRLSHMWPLLLMWPVNKAIKKSQTAGGVFESGKQEHLWGTLLCRCETVDVAVGRFSRTTQAVPNASLNFSQTYLWGSPLNFDLITLNIYADCQFNSTWFINTKATGLCFTALWEKGLAVFSYSLFYIEYRQWFSNWRSAGMQAIISPFHAAWRPHKREEPRGGGGRKISPVY